jgi:hypothetical protein
MTVWSRFCVVKHYGGTSEPGAPYLGNAKVIVRRHFRLARDRDLTLLKIIE